MSTLFGAVVGAAAANLQQGQGAASSSRDMAFQATMAAIEARGAVYDAAKAAKADFVKTREWVAGVQENVNEARGEIRAGWNRSIEASTNTFSLLEIAKKSESSLGELQDHTLRSALNTDLLLEMANDNSADHVKIAEAFNAMAEVMTEMKDEIIALRSEIHQQK